MRPSKPTFRTSYMSVEGYMMGDNVACVTTRNAPNMACNMLNKGRQKGKTRTTDGVNVHLVAF